MVAFLLTSLFGGIAPRASAAFYGGSGVVAFEQWVARADDPWDRQWDIYTSRFDRYGSRNLTQSTLVDESSAVWSPDGRSLAYVRSPVAVAADERSPLPPRRSSLIVSTASGNRSRLVLRSDEETGVILSVGWSPDGTQLVYTRNWYDYSQTTATAGYYLKGRLETIRLRDGRIRKLFVKKRVALVWPQWSPDGSKILLEAYHAAYGGPDRSLLMAGVDGSVISLASRGISGWWPSWTPEGDIVHTAGRPWKPDCFTYCTDVWVSDPFGEEPARMITNGPHDPGGDGWDDFLYRARLSPDGTQVAIIFRKNAENPYEESRQPQYQLWLLELRSQTWEKVADVGPPANVFGDSPGYNLSSVDWRTRCTVRGTRGRDVLIGTPNRDLICGLGGNDVIHGRDGDDVVFGHGGDDVITGGSGRDIVVGNGGRDRCDLDKRDHSRVC